MARSGQAARNKPRYRRKRCRRHLGGSSADDVDTACTLAEAAFDAFRSTPLEQRAQFLEAIAQGIIDLGDILVERVMSESGLPRPRIEGERARTVGQLRLFASLVREGRWLGVTIDPALPDRKPLPRPDLRVQKISLGPVAVFGASNFPLAFLWWLAETLPPRSQPAVRSLPRRILRTQVPRNSLGELFRKPWRIASCLKVSSRCSLVKAMPLAKRSSYIPRFRLSASPDRALAAALWLRLLSGRDMPIPVYAEMSSVNPMFLLPAALVERAEKIAEGFVDSVTLGVGQFCTKPGLVFGLAGSDFNRFRTAAQQRH